LPFCSPSRDQASVAAQALLLFRCAALSERPMRLTCPIRQGRWGDGYGTEASKLRANSAYSTGNAETEPIYLIVSKSYI
jgi:hypothetical protein